MDAYEGIKCPVCGRYHGGEFETCEDCLTNIAHSNMLGLDEAFISACKELAEVPLDMEFAYSQANFAIV